MEERFTLKIGRIRRAFRAHFEARAATLDITTPQYHVLSRLWQGDGVLTSVIAKDINVASSTLTGVLDRLENKGLIRREAAAKDRRVVEIWLTDKGRAMEEPLLKIINDINQIALQGFSQQQKSQFLEALDKVGENLE
jgi:DNA-binding MarR family transcriptional regulator